MPDAMTTKSPKACDCQPNAPLSFAPLQAHSIIHQDRHVFTKTRDIDAALDSATFAFPVTIRERSTCNLRYSSDGSRDDLGRKCRPNKATCHTIRFPRCTCTGETVEMDTSDACSDADAPHSGDQDIVDEDEAGESGQEPRATRSMNTRVTCEVTEFKFLYARRHIDHTYDYSRFAATLLKLVGKTVKAEQTGVRVAWDIRIYVKRALVLGDTRIVSENEGHGSHGEVLMEKCIRVQSAHWEAVIQEMTDEHTREVGLEVEWWRVGEDTKGSRTPSLWDVLLAVLPGR